jgi:hypothetical protein
LWTQEYKIGVPQKPLAKGKKVDPKEEADLQLEFEDDTPEEDRGREPLPKEIVEELDKDELEDYSEKVRKRIQHFSKGYHDERRAKEAAQREKDEALRFTQSLIDENNKLKGSVSQSQEALVNQAKRAAELEMAQAKAEYKAAYDSGDSDAVMNAQQKLTAITMKSERLANFKPAALQQSKNEVQTPPSAPAPVYDDKAANWRQSNQWFGADEEMTAFALGLHNKLVKDGVDPRSDTYYEKINSRMRQVFPTQFAGDEEPTPKPKAKASGVVAPATRSTAPKKIVLTHTQVALAKRLGLPLELYAKQVAEEMRKQNG